MDHSSRVKTQEVSALSGVTLLPEFSSFKSDGRSEKLSLQGHWPTLCTVILLIALSYEVKSGLTLIFIERLLGCALDLNFILPSQKVQRKPA